MMETHHMMGMKNVLQIHLKVSHQCATQSWDQHLPEPATKGLFLSSCCQGRGTSATPPFPDVTKSLLDSSPSPPIFLVSFFWALMQSNLKMENHLFLDMSQHLLQTLEGGGDTGLHEGEGGNARHNEWLNHITTANKLSVVYPSYDGIPSHDPII